MQPFHVTAKKVWFNVIHQFKNAILIGIRRALLPPSSKMYKFCVFMDLPWKVCIYFAFGDIFALLCLRCCKYLFVIRLYTNNWIIIVEKTSLGNQKIQSLSKNNNNKYFFCKKWAWSIKKLWMEYDGSLWDYLNSFRPFGGSK